MAQLSARHLRLLEYAQSLSPPPGFKVEVSGDAIIVKAVPSLIHQRNLLVVRQQFDAHLPSDLRPTENTDLASPTVGKLRNPDLAYLPFEATLAAANEIPADLAVIAVEIVSPSNPENDWVGKVRDYPLMGIPVYLLIDPRDSSIALFTEPGPDGYRQRYTAKFGQSVPIPEPFGFDLATTGLVPYA
ncbi:MULTISPECIES: Uma2 family endonuclease [unclassified Kitasatospora]|uniref:Uma2 family endonuclease n=1 Tax=unclassified Kitasatospora TaxID=2633591 RepID=UPI00070ACA05|nr:MULTISPECIES: Uma2 family endonuclease [unclassified Kitasatospora]KQV03277.1 hypothetical protein ASC99_15780 [Kitasatospora sp. Root107]KRB66139.1 hypothetical protein ASE03_31685 [Kitasatospora sp. Root187]